MNEWKKKLSYFVLLPLVSGCYILLIIRFNGNHKEVVLSAVKNEGQTTVYAMMEDTLLLNYADPFQAMKPKPDQTRKNDDRVRTGVIRKISAAESLVTSGPACIIVHHSKRKHYRITKENGVLKKDSVTFR